MAHGDEHSQERQDPLVSTPETDEQEASRVRRSTTAKRVLKAADERDAHADARDVAAELRDGEASRRSFLSQGTEPQDLKARRSAAIDREDSKTDRSSAAADRSELTRGD